jgi:hypothetical protein
MEVPTISIKIKGLNAIEALSGKGQLLGGLKMQGGLASMKITELEAKRVLVTKKGLILQEVEGHAVFDVPKAATKAATKGAIAKGMGAKSAIVVKGSGMKAVMVPTAAMSAKGLGWSLGLGGFGPWLALGALGLAATGVYFYLRAQAMESAPEQLEDIDSPI